MRSPDADVTDLEQRIKSECDACAVSLQAALRHAANAGQAIDKVFRHRLTQESWQRWSAGNANPIDRHHKMICRRIGISALDGKMQTLCDLMLDRAAEYLGGK